MRARKPQRSKLKGQRLTVRFDEGEDANVRRRAQQLGISSSALIRAATLDVVENGSIPTSMSAAIEKPEETSVSASDLRHTRTAINRVGGNINSMTRVTHLKGMGVLPGDDEPTDVLKTLNELRELIHQTQNILGGVWQK